MFFINRVRKSRRVSWQEGELPFLPHWCAPKFSCQPYLYSVFTPDVKTLSCTCRASYPRLVNETPRQDAACTDWLVTGTLSSCWKPNINPSFIFYIGYYITAEGWLLISSDEKIIGTICPRCGKRPSSLAAPDPPYHPVQNKHTFHHNLKASTNPSVLWIWCCIFLGCGLKANNS